MTLEFDIRRSILLSSYMKEWGMPGTRDILAGDETVVELYSFPGKKIQRFASVGLSACTTSHATRINSELLLVVPRDIAERQSKEIANYIFDIIAYLINTLGREIKPTDLISESSLAPAGWPRALLFDEPRGESEELVNLHYGIQHIQLRWVVPIHGKEFDLIRSDGIEAFDIAINELELSVVDVRRDSCI